MSEFVFAVIAYSLFIMVFVIGWFCGKYFEHNRLLPKGCHCCIVSRKLNERGRETVNCVNELAYAFESNTEIEYMKKYISKHE